MSLSQAMAKITSVTSKITSFSPSSLVVNVPSSAMTRALGIDGDFSLNSISDIRQSISRLKQSMATGLSLAYCSAMVFADGGKTALGFLENLASGAMGVITDIYQQIADAVAAQVGMAVSQIIGVVTSVVSALQNLVASILSLGAAIWETFKSWTDWSKMIFEIQIQRQNCKDMLSAIAACFLNKLLGPYIEQFTSNIVGKINQVGNTFNQKLFEEFQDINIAAAYANQQAFLIKKAELQMKGLTKQNLLGYDGSTSALQPGSN